MNVRMKFDFANQRVNTNNNDSEYILWLDLSLLLRLFSSILYLLLVRFCRF